MAVLKQSSSRAGVATGAVFSLGDLRVGAERALSDAQAEAARILEAAKREGERIRAAAERDGFAKGHAEGFAKGEAEGRTKGESEGHAAAKAAHDAALQAIEEGFATELGRWMAVREHVKGDPTVVAREAEAAIGLFARATRVTIEVAPEDAPILAESMPRLVAALPEGAAVSIVSREGVARGGCVIRSSEGSVDARLETQFRRMREGLIGGAAPEAESSGDAGSAS